MLTVSEIMTREPFTLGADDTVQNARQMMAQHNIRHIPIVDNNGCLVGLITQSDVLAAQDSTALNPDNKGNHDRNIAISTVMTSSVKTTREGASLRGAALFLLKKKLGCLPVVSDNKITGIITDSDFVTVAVNLMEQLELNEPEEIIFEEG